MTRDEHRPERQCIACGARRGQDELVRFRLETGEGAPTVVPDSGPGRMGRGAYVCPRLACLDLALRGRAFNRAFRRTVGWDEARLRRAVGDWRDETDDSEQLR